MQTAKCPQCGTQTAWQQNNFRPFCSERCRILDLGAWASDSYQIPGERVDTPTSNDDETSEV